MSCRSTAFFFGGFVCLKLVEVAQERLAHQAVTTTSRRHSSRLWRKTAQKCLSEHGNVSLPFPRYGRKKSPYLPKTGGLTTKAARAGERRKACRALLATSLFRDAIRGTDSDAERAEPCPETSLKEGLQKRVTIAYASGCIYMTSYAVVTC